MKKEAAPLLLMTRTCPRCASALAPPAGRLEACLDEHGAFVPGDQLARELPFAAMAAVEEATQRAERGDARCPACASEMALLRVERHGDWIELDHCPACRGTWFDAGEIERVKRQAPHLARAPAPVGGKALAGGSAAGVMLDPAMFVGIFELLGALFDQ